MDQAVDSGLDDLIGALRVCHIFAARALTHTLGGPPLRLKLVLDGREEMRGAEIPEFIERPRPRLAGAELCLTAGGPTRIDERPEVGFGVRGSAEMKLVQ